MRLFKKTGWVFFFGHSCLALRFVDKAMLTHQQHPFASNIYTIVQQIIDPVGVAVTINLVKRVDALLQDLFRRLLKEMIKTAHVDKRIIISSRDAQSAVRSIFRKNANDDNAVAKRAVSEGTKSVLRQYANTFPTKLMRSQFARVCKSFSKLECVELSIKPTVRIETLFLLSEEACLFVSGAIDHVCAELIVVADTTMKTMITGVAADIRLIEVDHLHTAIRNDTNLMHLFLVQMELLSQIAEKDDSTVDRICNDDDILPLEETPVVTDSEASNDSIVSNTQLDEAVIIAERTK